MERKPKVPRSRDLYKVLGVSSQATALEVKAAFRRVAAEVHPDKNAGDPKAALRFKRINAAYAVLGNREKRKLYDSLTEPIDDVSSRGTPPPHPRPPASRVAPQPESVPPPPRSPRGGTLRKAWRVMKWVGIAIFAVVVSLTLYAYSVERREGAEREAVVLDASIDATCTSKDHPVRVRLHNGSGRTVKTVDFNLEAFEVERSDDLLEFNSETWTLVVPAHRDADMCWPMPALRRTLQGSYFLRVRKGRTAFYEDGEFVPLSAHAVGRRRGGSAGTLC